MSATAAEAQVPPPPRRGRKTLPIALAVLVLLGTAGAGGWWYLQAQKKQAQAPVAGGAPAEKKRVAPTYLALETMVVNLADPGGERVVQLGITFDLANEKTAELIKAILPAIRSNVLMLVSQRTSEELLKRDGKEKLARDILGEVSRALKEDAADMPADAGKPTGPVHGVLFSSFIVQ